MTPPSSGLLRHDAELLVQAALDQGRLERAAAERLGAGLADAGVREAVLGGAWESKLRGHGDAVSFSRNVFIPLTNLCRDRCAYCTFAKQPDSPEAKTYSLKEVADVVRGGARTGCIEALFCLGDKPEKAYRSHRAWLARQGWRRTTDHLVEACRVAFAGGLLPHTNAGILSREDMQQLRCTNASMGLMLESTSQRLREKGGAHYYAPDKDPALRIQMHEEAGELRIPFTSGLLLGIGEDSDERVDTLLTIRDLSDRYGHIQEVIVQPFHPKPGTRMRAASPLSDVEIAAWVAMARLILGSAMQVQAPPNLAPRVLELLLRAGVSDWGGVSPVTVDYINPEAPWPTLRALRERSEAAGARLVERLPVHPGYLLEHPEFFDPAVRRRALELADESGYARAALRPEAA